MSNLHRFFFSPTPQKKLAIWVYRGNGFVCDINSRCLENLMVKETCFTLRKMKMSILKNLTRMHFQGSLVLSSLLLMKRIQNFPLFCFLPGHGYCQPFLFLPCWDTASGRLSTRQRHCVSISIARHMAGKYCGLCLEINPSFAWKFSLPLNLVIVAIFYC